MEALYVSLSALIDVITVETLCGAGGSRAGRKMLSSAVQQNII